MTPRLPPSRLLLLATPSHDPPSRSPPLAPPFSRRPSRCLPSAPHLPSPSSCTSFPLAPSLTLARSFSFRLLSFSLSRLLFCRGRRRKTRRDATRSFEIPDRGVPYVSASDRIAHLAAIFFRPLGRRLVTFSFSFSLSHSFCLSLSLFRAPDSASFSSASRTRAYAPSLQLGGDVPLARSCNLLTRVSCFSRVSCPCFSRRSLS